MTGYDVAVDFMDMTDHCHLCTHPADARAGFVPVATRYVVVGCDDAVSAVAEILSVNHEGHIELEVLPGPVDSHKDLLTPA